MDTCKWYTETWILITKDAGLIISCFFQYIHTCIYQRKIKHRLWISFFMNKTFIKSLRNCAENYFVSFLSFFFCPLSSEFLAVSDAWLSSLSSSLCYYFLSCLSNQKWAESVLYLVWLKDFCFCENDSGSVFSYYYYHLVSVKSSVNCYARNLSDYCSILNASWC